MILPLFVDSDNVIEWDEMKRLSDGAYINAATVRFTLKTTAGAVIAGATGIAMPRTAAGNGRYQGTLESTVGIAVGIRYFLELTATFGTIVAFRRIECIGRYKGKQ